MAPRSRFFAIVALLERLTSEAPRVGSDVAPHRERLRFRHDPSLGFSASDISEARSRSVYRSGAEPASGESRVVELTTTFLGLTGSMSPIPLHIAEEVCQEDDAEGRKRDFLDIFHHRLLSLFYRLWTRYDYAREYTTDGRDAWSPRVLALGGVDRYAQTQLERSSSSEPEGARLQRVDLLRILPLLVARGRSARALEVALATVIGHELENAHVSVQQFTGRWLPVDPDQHTRLGTRNHTLGRTLMLGRHAYDRAGHFAIRIGPVRRHLATRLSAGGDLEARIRALVDVFLRIPQEFDIEVELDPRERVGFRLSHRSPARLGKETWLSRRPRATAA